jgi:N-acetyl-D-muramate 6-phosphate phosphatase
MEGAQISKYHAILFDLDGTLADTAGDLGHALNLMLTARGMAAVELSRIRPHASAGARGLLALGFNLDVDHPNYESMRQEFLEHYEQHLARSTTLFPGVRDLLDEIEAGGMRWGIVTNKPHRFTLPVLRALGLLEGAACVISGDTTAHPKPHPAPMLRAAADLSLNPGACLYVGDDKRDIDAAHAAGMPAIVALYGYIGHGSPPEAWGADGYIDSPLELMARIGLTAGSV